MLQALISYKTCKELGILPDCYPNPIIISITVSSVPSINVTPAVASLSFNKHLAVQELPTVFNDNINSMEGEEFLIYFTDDARSFCVSTPRSILFAYCDKLKTKLDLLQSHEII